MGELVARTFDGDESVRHASIAVRSYIDEFTDCVIAALRRERVAAASLGRATEDEPVGRLSDIRRELANAACARIAVDVRAALRTGDVTAEDVAAIAGVNTNH